MPDNIKIEKLAHDVLALSRNTLMVKLRFMDAALCELCWEQTSLVGLASDMRTLWYDPRHLLRRYKKDRHLISRDYLHVVLHGVFCHAFAALSINRPIWNLACDIAAEAAISELSLAEISAARSAEQRTISAALKEKLGGKLTAERLYRAIADENWSGEKLSQAAAAFAADDHIPWYKPKELLAASISSAAASGYAGEDQSRHDQARARWKELSGRVKTDMETFSKEQGDTAGSLTQNLREVNRERYDYGAFLKKFATVGEVMRTNDDEFDYIFYTYGLSLYKNIPLIEPLEYKEVKRIREFVIAIDTSGSVSGELVQRFLNKTYNIFQQSESFFTKINVHIIQCDAEIQEDTKISSRREFDEYLRVMQLRGLGGTDFRPVFEYTDRLLREKEFTNLKGLIYFTDGYGTFPARKPDYETAFVFVDDEYEIPEVPVWAMRLVLSKGEI